MLFTVLVVFYTMAVRAEEVHEIYTELQPPLHNFPLPKTPIANNRPIVHKVDKKPKPMEPHEPKTSTEDDAHHGHSHKALDTSRNRYAAGWNGSKHEMVFRPRLLTGSDGDFLAEQDHKNNLCAVCFCTKKSQNIRCEHNHISYQDTKHRIIIDNSIIPRASRYIRFIGYDTVEIMPYTFASEDLDLDLLIFENVRNLVIQPNSLYFSTKARTNILLTIQFVHCNIPEIPRSGLTQGIEDNHADHEQIRRTNTRFLSITFIDSTVRNIRREGLSGARLIYFNITRTTIEKLEERAIDWNINELSLIEHSHLPTLHTSAICLHSRNVRFVNNTIKEIRPNAISIETGGRVQFERNRIGILHTDALMNITRTQLYGGISFIDNQITISKPGSLKLSQTMGDEGKIEHNRFAVQCECNITKMLREVMGLPKEEEGIDTKSMRVTLQEVIKTSQCVRPDVQYSYYIGSYLDNECTPFPIVTVAAVSVAGTLFILSVIICVFCSIRMQRHKEEGGKLNECVSQSFSSLPKPDCNTYPPGLRYDYPVSPHSDTTTIQWVAGLPELKTYQQGIAYDLTEQAESIRGSTNRLGTPESRFVARASCPFN